MRNRIPVLTFLLFSLACIVRAQGPATGAQETTVTVLDNSDGKPVPFCHICLEDKNTGKQQYVVGDVNGKATISLSGNLVLSVSALGYEHYFQPSGPIPSNLVIRLEPSYFGLDEVVVTGQYKPVRADKSIYDIKLIGKPAIRNLAANNMAELLSKELTFRINNDPSTGSSLNLQGISGENVKILVDGVPVIGRLDGNIDMSQINLENVDHVEIVEGPMSVVYGSNALAGVVNIITSREKYARFKTGLQTYYESVGVYNINGNVQTRAGNHSLSLTGGRNFFSGHDLDTSDRRMEWKPKEQYNGGVDYGFRKNETSIRYKTDYFRERLLDRSNVFNYQNGFDTWFRTTRFNNSFHLDHNLSENNRIHLLTAYSYYDRKKTTYKKDLSTLDQVLVTDPEQQDTSVFYGLTARGGFNHANEEGHLDYQAGFDINTEKGSGKRIRGGTEFIGDYAVFASLQWHPSGRFTFQPALRASYNTRYKAPLTPSLNLKYTLKETVFRVSYARGFRAPSLKELYLDFHDTNHNIEGNEDLDAEKSHNFNIAVSQQAAIHGMAMEIRGKVYYNRIKDRITLIPVDPYDITHYKNANINHFESVGGDIRLSCHPVRTLSCNLGISHTGRKDSYYKEDRFVFSTALIANLTQSFYRNLASVSVYYKYSGKFPVYVPITDDVFELVYFNPYHNLDITCSVKLFRQQIRLNTGVKNLLDNTILAGAGGGSGHGGGNGDSSLVGWGRTFFLGIEARIARY